MEERFQELAMLKLAGRASKEESSELEKLLSENASFRAEYDQLQKEIPAIKDLIPMLKSPETSDEEVPSYEKTAFLTDVGEIFGKLEDAKGAVKDSEESVPLLDSQMAGARFMPDTGADDYAAAPDKNDGSGFSFFKLALAGLAVCALVILINMPDKNTDPIAKTPEPVIQLAIVGEMRGDGNETVKLLNQRNPAVVQRQIEKLRTDLNNAETKPEQERIRQELEETSANLTFPLKLKLPAPPTSIGLGVITGTRVSARGKATVHSQLVFRFGQNEPVNILEEITLASPTAGEPPKWYRVQVPLDAGLWVHYQFLHNERIVNIAGNDGKSSPHTFARVKPTRLNVHGGAGDEFPVLGQLPQGTDVALTGEQKGKWLEIHAPGNCSVYVNAEYVRLKSDREPTP